MINGKKIFFADVADELIRYRDNLIKELKQVGCDIVLNTSGEEIHDLIEKSEMTIHLLSEEDKIVNDLKNIGFEEAQIRYSVQHSLSQKLVSDTHANCFKIIAWYPKTKKAGFYEEEIMPAHLKKIQQFDEVELLITNFEEFKYYLLQSLETEESNDQDEFYIKGVNNISIYFIHDLIDKKEAEEYIGYFGKRGFTVYTPVFSSDILQVRQAHQNCLKKFDIAIVFAAQANINWINMKILDILKSPGLGRKKPILGKAVYIPEEKIKTLAMLQKGFNFIQYKSDASFDQIELFINNSLNK
jgi:hypothetical protein